MNDLDLPDRTAIRPVAMTWRSRRRAGRTLARLALAAALVGAACSAPAPQDNRKPVFPVRGQVFVQDKPAGGAFVLFTAVNEPADTPDPRPRATAKPDGSFALSTYGDSDGAPAGEYVVTITWPGGVLPDGREEPEDKLLGRYADRAKSRLRAKVVEGPNELPAFRLR